MRVETQRCREFNHPEVALDLESDALALHANVLLGSIENLVANGEVLKPGETFQFGWLTLQIRALDADRLTLFEPDFRSPTVEYVPGANAAIRHMMVQLFTLDSFGIERARMMMPNMRQTVMACERFADAPIFFMTRNEPINHTDDSGWYMGCMDPDHDHNTHETLDCLTLYEAVLKRSDIAQWIMLPTEAKVFLSPNGAPKVWIGEDRCALQPASFVDELVKNDML